MSTGAPTRRGVLALAVVGAVALSGCTSTFTAQPYTPGVGTNVDAGDTKVRALVLVVDGEQAVLTGSLVSIRGNDALTKITGKALDANGNEVGDLTFPDGRIEVKPNTLVKLTDMKLTTPKGKLTPGFNADLTLQFERGGAVDITVPVVSTDHPDYADVKAG